MARLARCTGDASKLTTPCFLFLLYYSDVSQLPIALVVPPLPIPPYEQGWAHVYVMIDLPLGDPRWEETLQATLPFVEAGFVTLVRATKRSESDEQVHAIVCVVSSRIV